MRVFVSYRRAPNGAPSRLTLSVAAALKAQRIEVVFDRSHVKDQSRFASELVDRGLNHCDALIAIVDEQWLSQRNVGRLRASASVEHSTDWVEFELRYALNHRMPLALVGDGTHLSQVDPLSLPGPLSHLIGCRRFDTEGHTLDAAGAQVLASGLAQLSASAPRRPSKLTADTEHNSARPLPASRVLHEAFDASPVVGMAGTVERVLRRVLHGAAVLALFAGIGSLLRGSADTGLPALAVAALLLLLATGMRQGWAYVLGVIAARKARRGAHPRVS